MTTRVDPFTAEISRHIWDTRYRYRTAERATDRTVADTWDRVARALAAAEDHPARWEPEFRRALEGFRFLPGGRILAGAGVDRQVTLFNCFVMGVIPDSLDGIFERLHQAAVTMQQGGGVGFDFSTLRPAGFLAETAGTIASGPVSFMRIWDAMCATILSTGARRGAMMGTLRCDHPDIEAFVAAKATRGELVRFNLSVLVTDAFMEAVQAGADWPLVFPADAVGGEGATVERWWSGRPGPVPCRVVRTVRARALWDTILRATYDHAEPGVLFVDRINRENNLAYCQRITATNPCGEIPLQPWGACNLGSIDLSAFVSAPYAPTATLDLDGLAALATTAVRMLDDVVDVSGFPLPEQQEQALATRRLGLGITGLADALFLLGLHYDSDEARATAASAMRTLRDAAYRASVAIAREKGPFPLFERDAFLAAPFVQRLPADVRDGIAAHGLRNSHLLAIAPTGTISLLANNVSSGIEPVFALRQRRQVLGGEGHRVPHDIVDRAYARWRDTHLCEALPPHFVTALELSPEAHLAMQAALQPYVDNSISKTINVPADTAFASFRHVYDLAWARGLKGCTTYRPNPVTGAVLQAAPLEEGTHCCTLEREGG